MTILRKRLGVSTFAVLALAFCCLIIGQAAIAKVDKAVRADDADKSFEKSVPLPTLGDLERGRSRSSLADIIPQPKHELSMSEAMPLHGGRIADRKGSPGQEVDGIPKGVGDDFGNPIIIGDESVLPISISGDNTSGTDTDSETCQGADPCIDYEYCVPDDWYKFSPTVDMRISLDMCNGVNPGGDAAIYVYEDNLATLVGCNDDACDYMPSLVGQNVLGGHDYYIMIDGWGAGPYQMDISVYYDPYGDECATADYVDDELCAERINEGSYADCLLSDFVDLRGEENVLEGYKICGEINQDMTVDPPTSGGSRDSDHFLLDYNGEGLVTVTIRYMCESPSGVFIYDGTLEDGCFANRWFGWVIPANYEFVSDPVVVSPGTEMQFWVRAADGGPDCINEGEDQARWYVEFTTGPLTPVDDCPAAREIAGETLGVPIVQDICGFTSDGPCFPPAFPYGCYTYPGSAWFAWTCEKTGIYTFSACNTPNVGDPLGSYDLYMAVFNERCPEADGETRTELGFDDDSCPAGYEPVVEGVICADGLTYLIAIASYHTYPYGDGTVCGDVWLDIEWTEDIPLIGDNCEIDRIMVTENHIGEFINNINATPDGPNTTICNDGQLGGDLWLEVQAWMDGYATANFLYMNFDANMEVYAGAECVDPYNPRDPIFCNDDGGDPDDWPWDASGDLWPQEGHGSWASWPVENGQSYLIRLGGWYNPPANPLTVGGMGFGFYDIILDATGPGPDNDHCSDVAPVVLADGVPSEYSGDTYWATWNDCWNIMTVETHNSGPVWEAFTVPAGGSCMDVTIDFCNTPETDMTRYGGPAGTIWNGCPCDGDFVSIGHSSAVYGAEDCTRNYTYTFDGLAAGDYWVQLDFDMLLLDETWDYYFMTVTGTAAECTYCVADPNIASCPPVAGASWVSGVYLATLSNGGPSIPVDIGTGCNSYENFADPLAPDYPGAARLYKGMTYELAVDMGKQGTAGEFDLCDVWIDWNQSSSFYDVGDRTTMSRLALTWTVDLTPPMDAPLPGEGATGTTIMRIRMASTNDGENAPCGTSTWGEVEDYLIELMDLEIGDFNDPPDGVIDAGDIQFLMDWYFTGEGGPDFWQRADLDGDGVITIADIIALVDLAYGGA